MSEKTFSLFYDNQYKMEGFKSEDEVYRFLDSRLIGGMYPSFTIFEHDGGLTRIVDIHTREED